MHPAARVGCAVPALQGDAADVVALLIVQQFKVAGAKIRANLSGGTAQENQLVGSIVEQGEGAPTLRFAFRLVKHGLTLLGLELEDPPKVTQLAKFVKGNMGKVKAFHESAAPVRSLTVREVSTLVLPPQWPWSDN
jgi:hypothetical protein